MSRTDLVVAVFLFVSAHPLIVARGQDCNHNGLDDAVEIADGSSPDCNANGQPDDCDLAQELAEDCNRNERPDKCDLADGTSFDCNVNGWPDECDLQLGVATDCNGNAIPDSCDLDAGRSEDCNANAVPDKCELDCNQNGISDDCDIAVGRSIDCNLNDVPDECDTVLVSLESSDTPLALPPAGTSGTTISSVHVPDGRLVQDLEVVVDITHTFDRDLTATLIDPLGRDVRLVGSLPKWSGTKASCSHESALSSRT